MNQSCASDGVGAVVPGHFVIDCDVDPRIPQSFGRKMSVHAHQRQGKLMLDPSKVECVMHPIEELWMDVEEFFSANDFRLLLNGQQVLNANVLDYFLEHPEHAPFPKGPMCILFFGTEYRDETGRKYVRALYWYEEMCDPSRFGEEYWCECYKPLDEDFRRYPDLNHLFGVHYVLAVLAP